MGEGGTRAEYEVRRKMEVREGIWGGTLSLRAIIL